MSHVPLLTKQPAPKLQPIRRGPQVVCLCLLAGLVFLIVPSSVYAPLLGNATRATIDPLPPELLRVIEASTQHRLVTEDTLRDLLATVSYLARREMNPR